MGISIQVNNQRNDNISIFGKVAGVSGDKSSGKSFFAGNLTGDPIEQRRKQAQQKAFMLVSDVWENDKKTDEGIQTRRDDFLEQLQSKEEAEKQLAKVNQNMKALQEAYGVEDDSQEQKDLLIWEKYYDSQSGVPHEAMTDDEKKRLGELMQQPKTEYQEAALELNNQAGMWKEQIETANNQMTDDIKDITSIRLERLKTHPMVDAQKDADAIMAAANKEILGMLIAEGKEHLDEIREEEQEKAEEKKEEEKTEEERLERVEEKRAIQEALIEGSKEAVAEARAKARENDADDFEFTDIVRQSADTTASGGVSKSLEDIKNSMKLLEADLKGIQVDEEV